MINKIGLWRNDTAGISKIKKIIQCHEERGRPLCETIYKKKRRKAGQGDSSASVSDSWARKRESRTRKRDRQ